MKTPDQMTAQDYADLGLRCGLEIHQQLKTRTKLFCRCPATSYAERYDAEILRHMRPTLSELGEYDPTALMEFKTRKEIIYRIARETVCTYEMDDAPPFELNRQALDIALEVALLLGCKIVGELHIARKQYLDGSIPTGFQRTTILGVDGSIPVGRKTIGIRQLALEEDSCREVSDRGHRRVYMTDRLSIPLIETVTEAELHTPQEAAAAAEVIRRLARVTGKVRTGAGAGRQDVNVSIHGGCRVEIKGVPSIRMIPPLVHYEGLRQKALLDIRDELRRRDLTADSFTAPTADVTNLLRHTSVATIRRALGEGARVFATRLPRFRGILRHRTGPNSRFEREFRGRVRVVACLVDEPYLLHDDAKGSIVSLRILEGVRRVVGAEDGDTVTLVWGQERDARLAATEVGDRAREAIQGVPLETRQVRVDGSTRFERLLPGPDRMYPDTDLPPIALAEDHIARVRAEQAMPPWEMEKAARDAGLSQALISDLFRSGRLDLYGRLRHKHPDLDPRLVARVVGQMLRSSRRRWARHLDDTRLEELFERVAEGRVCREALPAILDRLGRDRTVAVDTALSEIVPILSDERPWQERARELLDAAAPLSEISHPEPRQRWAMGLLMNGGLRGRVDGAKVFRWLQNHLAAETGNNKAAP